jgi:16S rRNA (adenine1518-N6/adenine1519-N6)-dimethyltransferase
MPRPQAKKRFGQHFLQDRRIVERIVAAFDPRPKDHAVEIGPGPGAVTYALLGRVETLEAVEIDRDLAARLKADIPADRFRLHLADALSFDFCRLVRDDRRLRLIGNLPYNISTPLLFHLLDQSECLQDMLFMLQKEVVERLVARPGGKDYGRLSVMIQWRCRLEKLFDVAPDAFSPPPKVTSSVVRLAPYRTPPIAVRDRGRFATVVAAAFGARRKTLKNNLKGLVSPETMAALGIDPRRRAETLSLEEFAKLAEADSPY